MPMHPKTPLHHPRDPDSNGRCLLACFLDVNLRQKKEVMSNVNKSVCYLAQTLLLPSRAWRLAATCPAAAVDMNKPTQTVWAMSSPMIWSNHHISPLPHRLHAYLNIHDCSSPKSPTDKKQGFHSPQNIHLTKPLTNWCRTEGQTLNWECNKAPPYPVKNEEC